MVEVVKNIPLEHAQNNNTSSLIIGAIFVGLIIVAIIGIILWVSMKIFKKIRHIHRKSNDLEYKAFCTDLKLCRINRDSRFFKRSFLRLWLFPKKAKVYLETSMGKKFAGRYLGEAFKKEGFFLIALENAQTFFKRDTIIIIIPTQIVKKIVKKNDDFTITIKAESVDEVSSSEYYYMPVIQDKEDNKFLDFSDYINDNYFKRYSHRAVIHDMVFEFRDIVKDAIDLNPIVPYSRKTNSNPIKRNG